MPWACKWLSPTKPESRTEEACELWLQHLAMLLGVCKFLAQIIKVPACHLKPFLSCSCAQLPFYAVQSESSRLHYDCDSISGPYYGNLKSPLKAYEPVLVISACLRQAQVHNVAAVRQMFPFEGALGEALRSWLFVKPCRAA